MSFLAEEEIQKVAEAAIAGSGGILDENKVIGAIQYGRNWPGFRSACFGASWKAGI